MRIRSAFVTTLAFCMLLTSAAWAGNGQNLVQYIPAGPTFVMSIDVTQIWNHPLFQQIWTMATADPEVTGQLAELQTQGGFNPATDLQTLVLALNPDVEDRFVALIEGNFNPAMLTTYIGVLTEGNVGNEQYAGQTVYFNPTEPDPAARQNLVFINNNLAVFGTTAELHAVLDVVGATAQNIQTIPAMATALTAADTTGVIWYLGSITPGMQAEMVGSPMAGMQAFRGAINLTGGLNIATVVTNDTPENAAGMAAFVQTNLAAAAADPTMAQMGMGALFQGVTVAAVGNDVTVSMSIPDDVLNQLMAVFAAMAMGEMGGEEQEDPMPEPIPPTAQ